MSTERSQHSCTVIQDMEQNKKLLVVGGSGSLKTTEWLDMATLKWYYGVDAPLTVSQATLISTLHSYKNAAFLMGGTYRKNLEQRANLKIFALNKELTEWSEVAGSYTNPFPVAVQLSPDMIESCNGNILTGYFLF